MAFKCRQRAHKEAAATLLLTNPLNPSVHAVGLSRFYLLPNDQKCHDEHKYVIGGLTEGQDGLCTSYQSPGAGSPAGGEQYLPPGPPASLAGLFLQPGQAVYLRKPPLFTQALNPNSKFFQAQLNAHFPLKVHSLNNPQEHGSLWFPVSFMKHCMHWNVFSQTVLHMLNTGVISPKDY